MIPLDHSRWEEDLAAYMLGALDGRERADLEEHLRRCERCQADQRWLEPALDVLPGSVAQLDAPARLRRRVLDAVAREAAASDSSQGARPSRRWRSLTAPRPALAAIASGMALLAGVAGGYALRGDDGPPTETVPVRAAAPQARQATAAILHRGDAWMLDVKGMPALRPGDVYQVWMRDGRQLLRSVRFVLSDAGGATIALPARMEAAEELMITREASSAIGNAPGSAPMLTAQL